MGVMPSSGNSLYQSSSRLLSLDNGTGCWTGGFVPAAGDPPPLYLYATGRSRALSVTLLAENLIRHMPEMEMQAEHLGSAATHACSTLSWHGPCAVVCCCCHPPDGDPKWTMPPWPARGKLQACAFSAGGPWKRRRRSVAPCPDQL